jgi:hypothetical protein
MHPTNRPGVAAGKRKGRTVRASDIRIWMPVKAGMGRTRVRVAYTAARRAARVRSWTENLRIKKPPFSCLENAGADAPPNERETGRRAGSRLDEVWRLVSRYPNTSRSICPAKEKKSPAQAES